MVPKVVETLGEVTPNNLRGKDCIELEDIIHRWYETPQSNVQRPRKYSSTYNAKNTADKIISDIMPSKGCKKVRKKKKT